MTVSKEIIVQLILQDLKHEQLIGNLVALGFETDKHSLKIMEIVANLMGVQELEVPLVDLYMEFIANLYPSAGG